MHTNHKKRFSFLKKTSLQYTYLKVGKNLKIFPRSQEQLRRNFDIFIRKKSTPGGCIYKGRKEICCPRYANQPYGGFVIEMVFTETSTGEKKKCKKYNGTQGEGWGRCPMQHPRYTVSGPNCSSGRPPPFHT